MPGYYLSVVKAGSSTGIVEDTCAYTYDIYLVGHKALPDAVVRNVLQAIWVNIDKLPQFHPGFAEWTKDRAVDAEVTIPYHPAAIRFLKDQNALAGKDGRGAEKTVGAESVTFDSPHWGKCHLQPDLNTFKSFNRLEPPPFSSRVRGGGKR